jgi:DNA-binding MarR family transcriptional regulator
MTALIGKLIREGLVVRVQEKTDQRIIRVELTEKGRKFIDERKKIAKEAIRANLEPLAEQDLNELCESLEKINRIIAKLNEI